MGFISKVQAEENVLLNKKNKARNEEHKQKIDLINLKSETEINEFNLKLKKDIDSLNSKIVDLNFSMKNIKPFKNIDGWINIQEAFNFSNENLAYKKGVYIIWNKTKNKHYVGQSKNLYRRIFNQHFSISKANVQSSHFAKDWYDKNEFYYKYFICATKNELDNLEKKYIEIYDSFNNGYNSTRGND